MKVTAVLLVVLLLASCGWAEEILVAAAADLNQALPVIAEQFERESGNRVKVSFGSSGNFFAQIQNGAPFDVFFSADIDFPKRLEAAGLTEPGSLYEYAVGKIVLWVPNGSGLDVGRGLSALLDPQVRKIAIANPMHAPYGKAAMAALQHEQLYERVKDKLVLGENIRRRSNWCTAAMPTWALSRCRWQWRRKLREPENILRCPLQRILLFDKEWSLSVHRSTKRPPRLLLHI